MGRGNSAAAAADAEVYLLLDLATPDERAEAEALMGRMLCILQLLRERQRTILVAAVADALPETVRPRPSRAA